MAIKESALSLITSIAQGDWVRAVTSAGASRRITVANLAKAIVESYTGSSLAGSAQSVKTALDSVYTRIANASTSGAVNLKSYNSLANRYTFPYDGYVVLDAGGGATAGQIINFVCRTANNINAAGCYKRVTGSYDVESIYVRAGMFCWNASGNDAPPNYAINYYPFDLA
jgi:hypothetical protein